MSATSSIAKIRNFDQLLRYLEEELDWPIDEMEIDDITFEYDPEEDLGLDAKTAAKIRCIKQLRPISANQPFGIFFIEFEPKSLPVVAMRRVLGKLVTKKRESANPSDRKTWSQDDLLFVSACGEDNSRRIDFAHFADDAENRLPTLRVLGWDGDDTNRKVDWVESQLKSNLLWPDDSAPDEWRIQWRSAFTLRQREAITTAKGLAVRLADLARDIRARVNSALSIETEKGPLTTLMKAFRESLIHDLEPDDFADMYAQTIAYGLLSARVSRPAHLVADNLADMVPITNPFLKELLETFLNVGGRKWSADKGKLVGIDFDELGVNEVVDTLREANMEAVLRDFDNRNPQEDPVLHFYEHFLKEYDAQKRMQRGVFYTPKPIVSYIVRSVHKLLQTEFGLPLGLADTTTWGEMAERNEELKIPEGTSPESPFVQILDPATGTATFLVEVIDLIHKTMIRHWESEGVRGELFLKQKWNEYVPRHLLPRLHGYELMMAPYAIAHMKIGLKLFETGYTFEDDERARVYLTNALEPPQDFSDQFEQMIPALAHEALAVNEVKRHQRFTIVIGNPPYAGFSSNHGSWISNLINSYRFIAGNPLEEKKVWLKNDYVKFLRLSQFTVHQSGAGVIGMITDHSYIDSPTFRGLRHSFLNSFELISLVNLHGNSKRRESSPDGAADENVFDITQGVVIGLFAHVVRSTPSSVSSADLWGTRNRKYDQLAEATELQAAMTMILPEEPYYCFTSDTGISAIEYLNSKSVTQIFPLGSNGVQTSRDSLVLATGRDELVARFAWIQDGRVSDDEILQKYGVENKVFWKLEDARRAISTDNDWKAQIVPYAYRPFDNCWIFASTHFVHRLRRQVMQHMEQPNLALCVGRAGLVTQGEWNLAFVTTGLCDHNLFYRGSSINAPLFLYSDTQLLGVSGATPSPNIDSEFAADLALLTGSPVTPENVIAYVYALLYSRSYRSRYAHLLNIDFPRILMPQTPDLFRALVHLGEDLLALHLMQSPHLDKPCSTIVGSSEPVVEKLNHVESTVWLNKEQTCGFVGVPEEVWNFHIGGYQVCHKWLKDRQAKGGKNPRPGRVLTNEDIAHYCKIVTAIHHTIRIMGEIDDVIEQHGGWPDAFVTEGGKS